MYSISAFIISALIGSTFALPNPKLAKRDFTSNGVVYIVDVVTDFTTTTVFVNSATSTPIANATSSLVGLSASPTSAVMTSSTTQAAVVQSVSSNHGFVNLFSNPFRSSSSPTTLQTSTSAPAPVVVVPTTPPAAPAPVPTTSVKPVAVAATTDSAPPAPTTVSNPVSGLLGAAQILAISPAAASCAGAPFPAECITAAQAAPAISDSFNKYGISSKGAQAAVLALMLFESGGLKYNQNHYPGRPGQGTRAMLMPNYVAQYATAVYGAAKVQALGGDVVGILNLVSDTEDSCGAAAWFLSSQCPGVLKQFATDPQGAFTAYVGSGCVGSGDGGRGALFTTALAALGA